MRSVGRLKLYGRGFGGLCWLLLVLYAPLSQAVVESYDFSSEDNRHRYNKFINELRCPKCQNQNLAGSNSPIAQDLRREVHRMIEDGQQDETIVDYMVARYGDFVLYRPRLDKNTIVLWAAPVVFVLIGLIAVLLVVRHHRPVRRGATPATLSDRDRENLKQLLDNEINE